MRNPSWLTGRLFLLIAFGLSAAGSTTSAADKALLRLNAFAVNLSGVGSPNPQRLDIVIERWSTDEERKALIDTLVEKGSEALYDAVQKIKPRAGYIRTSTSLGWDVQFARQTDLPTGGRRVVFATDRPMGFYELRQGARSTDYEFMVCEVRLGPDGKGEGKLAGATKITWDKATRTIEVENYGIEPARLTQVTVEK